MPGPGLSPRDRGKYRNFIAIRNEHRLCILGPDPLPVPHQDHVPVKRSRLVKNGL